MPGSNRELHSACAINYMLRTVANTRFCPTSRAHRTRLPGCSQRKGAMYTWARWCSRSTMQLAWALRHTKNSTQVQAMAQQRRMHTRRRMVICQSISRAAAFTRRMQRPGTCCRSGRPCNTLLRVRMARSQRCQCSSRGNQCRKRCPTSTCSHQKCTPGADCTVMRTSLSWVLLTLWAFDEDLGYTPHCGTLQGFICDTSQRSCWCAWMAKWLEMFKQFKSFHFLALAHPFVLYHLILRADVEPESLTEVQEISLHYAYTDCTIAQAYSCVLREWNERRFGSRVG